MNSIVDSTFDLLRGDAANRYGICAFHFSRYRAQYRFSVTNSHTKVLVQSRRNEGQADTREIHRFVVEASGMFHVV